MMQGLPYHPFMNLMARWFDLDMDDEVEVACEKVSRRLGKPYEHIESEYPVLCRFLSLPIERLGGPARRGAQSARPSTWSRAWSWPRPRFARWC